MTCFGAEKKQYVIHERRNFVAGGARQTIWQREKAAQTVRATVHDPQHNRKKSADTHSTKDTLSASAENI